MCESTHQASCNAGSTNGMKTCMARGGPQVPVRCNALHQAGLPLPLFFPAATID